jgi:hypothetical protein
MTTELLCAKISATSDSSFIWTVEVSALRALNAREHG